MNSHSSTLSLLLLLLFFSWIIVLAGNASAHFCAEQDDPLLMASTLGGVHDSQGASNSTDVDELARFAVEEHNKKEVNSFSFDIRLFKWILFLTRCFLSCRVSLILADGVCAFCCRSRSCCVLCCGLLCFSQNSFRDVEFCSTCSAFWCCRCLSVSMSSMRVCVELKLHHSLRLSLFGRLDRLTVVWFLFL